MLSFRLLAFRYFALLVIFSSTIRAHEHPWRFSNPRPHGNNIYDMASVDGVIWQVGDRGQVYTSSDLDSWFPHESGTALSLRGITVFRGDIFISAERGGILSGSTPDGLSLQLLNTEDWLEGITASPDLIVAVGDNGAIYSSPNGSDWTRRGNFTTWLRSVAYGDGIFVCAGEGGFLAVSPDGISWERRFPGNINAHLNKVSYLNDRFWVVGENGTVLTNNLAMAFSPVNTGATQTLFAIAGNTNEVVLAGELVVMLGNLANGSWSPQADANTPSMAPLWPYYSALWDGRLFLLGGRTGMKVEGYRTNPARPLGWYSQVQPTRNWLWSVTRAPNLYAAVGTEGTIVTSLDGLEWTREVVPTNAREEILLGVGGNTNLLVAVGSEGTILTSLNVVTNVVSTNSTGQIVTNEVSLLGLFWNEASPRPTTNNLQGVAATGNNFVVTGGKGTILYSADGSTWQPRQSGVNAFLSGAASWPGGFVAVGSAGTIVGSLDGSLWTSRVSGTMNWIYAVRNVGGKLLAVGENGLILSSEDGFQWQAQNSGTSEWLNDVTFANGDWYITAGSGLILTSPDAVTWSPMRSITSKSLYSAASDGEQLIAVGLEGVILRRQVVPFTTPVNFLAFDLAGGSSFFLFEGRTDQEFILEEKGFFGAGWNAVANLEIVDPTGTLIYVHPMEAGTTRFYRTRLK